MTHVCPKVKSSALETTPASFANKELRVAETKRVFLKEVFNVLAIIRLSSALILPVVDETILAYPIKQFSVKTRWCFVSMVHLAVVAISAFRLVVFNARI